LGADYFLGADYLQNKPPKPPDFDKPYSTSLDKQARKNPLFLAGFRLLWTILDYELAEGAGFEIIT
jgi:hypothetical protein